MEVVLQWMDELEDTLFAAASLWEYLRGALLKVGFLAALALHASAWWPAIGEHAPVLAGIALASVLAWSIALLSLIRADFGEQASAAA